MTQLSQGGQASFLDLSARAKLSITGTDRFRFLNGQITNDLRKATGTNAIEACVLNAKGKIDAHVFVSARDESFLVDAELNLREKLRARLERYIIADDVQIEDVTDQFSLLHVLSEQPPTAAINANGNSQRISRVRIGTLLEVHTPPSGAEPRREPTACDLPPPPCGQNMLVAREYCFHSQHDRTRRRYALNQRRGKMLRSRKRVIVAQEQNVRCGEFVVQLFGCKRRVVAPERVCEFPQILAAAGGIA